MRPQMRGIGAPSAEAMTRRSWSRGPSLRRVGGANSAWSMKPPPMAPDGATDHGAERPAQHPADRGAGILQNESGWSPSIATCPTGGVISATHAALQPPLEGDG